jgi:hypothetical protein
MAGKRISITLPGSIRWAIAGVRYGKKSEQQLLARRSRRIEYKFSNELWHLFNDSSGGFLVRKHMDALTACLLPRMNADGERGELLTALERSPDGVQVQQFTPGPSFRPPSH